MRVTACVERRPAAVGAALSGIVPLAVTLATAGIGLLSHFNSTVVGRNPSNDFQIMVWSLRFWPWAIAHGRSLAHTTLLWSPSGFSTLWLTSIPLPSVVAAPLTLSVGPLATYNVLMLAAPALAGVAAFWLCWEATASVAASVIGGVSFALSPYLLGHLMSEHLNLVFVFPLPLLGRAGVRYMRERISRRRFVLTTAALLLVVLGCSLELFADVTVMLAASGALMLAVAAGSRPRFVRLAVGYGLGYAAIAPVLIPVAILALSAPHGQVTHPAAAFSTDLWNVAIPTPTLLLGSFGPLAHVSARFVGNIGERDGFLGPLLLGSVAALWTAWRRIWPAGAILLLSVFLSLGPTLAAAGRPLLLLPSLAAVPVAGDALPARFAVFASLAASVLTACWLAASASVRWRGARIGVAALVIFGVVPNLRLPGDLPNAWAISSRAGWSTTVASVVFAPKAHNVLVLPAGDRTESLWWQASSGMRFGLAIPDSPFVPPTLAADPTIAQTVDNVLPQLEGVIAGTARLRSLLVARRIDTVVVTPAARRLWLPIVRRAVANAPVVDHGLDVFFVPRRVPPLTATVALPVHGPRNGIPLQAQLRFGPTGDERLRIGAGRGHGRTIEGRFGPVFATTAPDRAAVSFVQWVGSRELLRVATYGARRWKIATVAEVAGPIWSARTVIAEDGPINAAWVQDLGATRRLQVATLEPGGWSRPHLLDAGLGLGSFAVINRPRTLTFRWTDALSGESRLLAARLHHSNWSRSAVLLTGPLGSLTSRSRPRNRLRTQAEVTPATHAVISIRGR
jgi:hypothetical protein